MYVDTQSIELTTSVLVIVAVVLLVSLASHFSSVISLGKH